MNKKKIIWLVIALFWMGLIFSFSSQRAEQSSEVSGGITYRMAEAIGGLSFFQWEEEQMMYYGELWEHPIRKGAHMTEYGILAVIFLANFAQYKRLNSKKYAMAFAATVAYATTDEFHQLFVEGRSGQFSDVCIDGMGGLLGLFAVFLITRFIMKKKNHCIDG